MKRYFAAILAVLMIILCCSCVGSIPPAADPAPPKAPPAEEAKAPEESSAAPQPPADADPVEIEPSKQQTPAQAQPTPELPQPSGAQQRFIDEPIEYQADIEEIVSYQFCIPNVRLESEEASKAINDRFLQLAENMIEYAEDTVYDTAQQMHAIGFLEGSYTASIEDGALVVNYTRTERYAQAGADGSATSASHTYYFDLSSGEEFEH